MLSFPLPRVTPPFYCHLVGPGELIHTCTMPTGLKCAQSNGGVIPQLLVIEANDRKKSDQLFYSIPYFKGEL